MSIISPMVPIDTSDRPFGLRTEVVIDLPFPPSVNRIWRAQRRQNGKGIGIRISPEYQKWKVEADTLALMLGSCRDRNRVRGPFEAAILLNMEAGLGDIDNRIKAVLDWLQSRDVIENDRLCMELSIKWALPELAPEGCRVTVRALA